MQVEGVGFQLSWVRSRDVQRLMPNLASAWEFPTFGRAASRGMPLLACVRKLPSRLYTYIYIYIRIHWVLFLDTGTADAEPRMTLISMLTNGIAVV